MIITKPYKDYFQKSKAFLYPLTGMPKNTPFLPVTTFISIQGYFAPNDYKLAVLYKENIESQEWLNYLNISIISNPYFESYAECIENNKSIIIYNLSKWNAAFESFLKGRYSQFTSEMRDLIKIYYGPQSGEWAYMESFLEPQKFIEVYASIFNVKEDLLKQVGELIDAPALEREILTGVESFTFRDIKVLSL